LTKAELKRQLEEIRNWPTPASEGWLLVGKYRQPSRVIVDIWLNFEQGCALRKVSGVTQSAGSLTYAGYDAMEFEHRIGSEVLLEVAC